jgi:hypothetical protein
MLTSNNKEFLTQINLLSEYLFSLVYNSEESLTLDQIKEILEEEILSFFGQFPELKKFLVEIHSYSFEVYYTNVVNQYFILTYNKYNFPIENKLKISYKLVHQILSYANFKKLAKK